jgi:hypothetical protein
MGFRHVGQVLMFDIFGKLQSDFHFWNQFLDRVVGRVADLGQLANRGRMALRGIVWRNILKILGEKGIRKIFCRGL